MTSLVETHEMSVLSPVASKENQPTFHDSKGATPPSVKALMEGSNVLSPYHSIGGPIATSAPFVHQQPTTKAGTRKSPPLSPISKPTASTLITPARGAITDTKFLGLSPVQTSTTPAEVTKTRRRVSQLTTTSPFSAPKVESGSALAAHDDFSIDHSAQSNSPVTAQLTPTLQTPQFEIEPQATPSKATISTPHAALSLPQTGSSTSSPIPPMTSPNFSTPVAFESPTTSTISVSTPATATATETTVRPTSQISQSVGEISQFHADLVKSQLEDSLQSFQSSIYNDIQNLHLELLRQFQLQQVC